MKIFVDLGNQINDEPHFAFYDTITDTFDSIYCEQVWASVDDFVSNYEEEGLLDMNDIDRYLSLVPDSWKT